MSDYNWTNIDPDTESGTDLANRLNSLIAALASNYKGSTAPANATIGKFWLDDSAGTTWTLKIYDGATWNGLLTIDTSANTVALATSAPLDITQSDLATGHNFMLANVSDTIEVGYPEETEEIAEHTGGGLTPDISLGNIQNVTIQNNVTLEPADDNGTMIIRMENNGTITAATFTNLTVLSGEFDLTDGATNILGLITMPGESFVTISSPDA